MKLVQYAKQFQIEELMLTGLPQRLSQQEAVYRFEFAPQAQAKINGTVGHLNTPRYSHHESALHSSPGRSRSVPCHGWFSVDLHPSQPETRLCQFSIESCSLLERPTWNPILQLVPESVPISFCCPIFPDSLSFLSSGYYYSRFKLDSDHVKPAPSTPVEDAFATVLILAQSYGIGVSCGGLSTVRFFFL